MHEFIHMMLPGVAGYSATAVSDVADRIQNVIGAIFQSNEGVQFLTANKVVFEDRLRTAIDETVIDDDQFAIPAGAIERALRLVQALPVSFPIPEVAIDPDGAISLDWVGSRTRIFSISVGDSDRVAYAWINSSDRGNGVVRFAGSLPQVLLSQLRDIVTNVTTPLWAA
ncbi:hypothetical protein [Acidithiobacillus ferrooxidans]|uniref:hypothetical protein n=1 Tax=Acidithiobacillus ferrooxidans TaxID=920 RepID=UPI0015DC3CB0|nr:hypothetical protein [Acidithiobacillus ferrooxidans]MCR1344148.1 hypothetical protein [Acidithiobacillus ferrooxidans]QLK42593.1 hypothetical protein FE661_10790 [Acidithiobacillus ferrooxidans]QZT51675.1 hypothetical protein K7B00_10770 [Acidithiobacillus ferrooxidans]BDB15041.1 hypothetical protein ANFP_23610 [Acidithiobacillus ferrooxidans]